MKAVGLITEYNPMHNGHIYHLEKAKSITHSDCTIAVMSGNFVQRGEPAIIDKFTRAAAAIDSGINLIVELPACYALSSAEGFADGAVKILNALDIQSVVFGSECGNINILNRTAHILINETQEYSAILKNELSSGLSFPAARQQAINKLYGEEYSNILESANNILGIEYIKSIIKNGFSIEPFTIKREGTGYNETTLNGLPSASAIRAAILSSGSVDFTNLMPESMSRRLLSAVMDGFKPVVIDDFSEIFNYKMEELFFKCDYNKTMIIDNLSLFPDISSDLAARIYKVFNGHSTISEYCMAVKSRQYTYSRISRCVMHITLDLKAQNTSDYIRVLGFDNIGAKYLNSVKKTCALPIITKTADYSQILTTDIHCSNIYNQVFYNKCNGRPIDEFRHVIYIKK